VLALALTGGARRLARDVEQPRGLGGRVFTRSRCLRELAREARLASRGSLGGTHERRAPPCGCCGGGGCSARPEAAGSGRAGIGAGQGAGGGCTCCVRAAGCA
jgi:hypothetical protein